MPAYKLSFHDSEVAAVAAESTTLTVRLSVAAVRHGARAGYLPEVSFIFHGAQWHGSPFSVCVGRLVDGQWQQRGVRLQALPLPYDGRGPVTATLVFQNREQLHVQAVRVEVRTPDLASLAESYAC
jgi:hypothetical protein